MHQPSPVALVEKLVSMDTTSSKSNLEIIEYIADYLDGFCAEPVLTFNHEKTKANLYASFGPDDKSGMIFSGHTDVVPVEGQDWSSDPYKVVERQGKLFGRGTSDMKSFIAVCLSLAPEIASRKLHTPIHFAFSYDEEVGCIGVRRLIDNLSAREIKPKSCLVGEPTSMQVVNAHKGKLSRRCHIHGLECHSGMPQLGANAVHAAARAVTYLADMADRIKRNGPFDSGFEPPYTSVHTGVMQGGTALNIVPNHASFDFEFRTVPNDDAVALFDELKQHVDREILPALRENFADARIEFEEMSAFNGLSTAAESELVSTAQRLLGSNELNKVSFGTEAGLFAAAGIESIVVGPGSINVAHKPDEYIEIDQIERCHAFLTKVVDEHSTV